MNRKTISTSVFIVSLSLGLVGCFQASSENHGNEESISVITYQQMQEEYRKSVEQLKWPQDYTPPLEVEGEDQNISFQSGYGDSRASMKFECAWEKEWLKTYSTDTARANTALKELEKVPTMGFMSPQRADEATREIFKEYLERAKLGDPSGFQENVELNCP